MTRTLSATIYAQCTDVELRRFVSDRGLAAGDAQQRSLIRALRDADRDATFRFLDLSPELRNLVYEHLLTIRPKQSSQGRQYCYPNILRSSKQTYAEGTGILYNNEEPIIIELAGSGQYSPINISVGNRVVGSGSRSRSGDATVEWPSFVLKVRKLHVVVHCETQPATWRQSTNIQINHALYDLSQFLVSRPKPATSKVIVHEQGVKNLDLMFPMLVPIVFFEGVMDVEAHYLPNSTQTIQEKLDALEISWNNEDLLRKLYRLEGVLQARDERINEVEAALRDVSLVEELTLARRRLQWALVKLDFFTVADHKRLRGALRRVDRDLQASSRWEDFERADEQAAKNYPSKEARDRAIQQERWEAMRRLKKQRRSTLKKVVKKGSRKDTSKKDEDSSLSENDF